MRKITEERRSLIVPGDQATTLAFCVDHWLKTAKTAIQKHGHFAVALSGGTTPHAIYRALAERKRELDWNKVFLFWSDERAVPPDHPESNYQMAMQAGLNGLGIPTTQIFRMNAEGEAEEYEKTIKTLLKDRPFDLVMLGMGEDGHTASLFPGTAALTIQDRLVARNYVPQKKSWRMTLTFPCINSAKNITIYVLGKNKQEMLFKVFRDEKSKDLPVQKVGTVEHPALWIADQDAAGLL